MNNADIDWSKAPEGATHYDKVYRRFCNKGGWWSNAGDFVDDPNQPSRLGTDRYIPRPQAWKEGDLPPIGTECHVRYARDKKLIDHAEWCWCKLLATNITPNGKLEYVFQNYNGYADVIRGMDAIEFRPLKSEKDRQIERMLEIIEMRHSNRELAQHLYDAGCRLPDTDQD
jgi:hypothetical protein